MVQDDHLLKTVQLIPRELIIKLKFLSTVSTRSNGCGLHLLLRAPPASALTQSLATLFLCCPLTKLSFYLRTQGTCTCGYLYLMHFPPIFKCHLLWRIFCYDTVTVTSSSCSFIQHDSVFLPALVTTWNPSVYVGLLFTCMHAHTDTLAMRSLTCRSTAVPRTW